MLHLLFSATILLAGGQSSADTTLLGRFVLPSVEKTYGGLSAVHIGDQGNTFLAVSDRGGFVTGTIDRNEDGTINEIAVAAPIPIDAHDFGNGATVQDAEGVAVGNDGTIYVSFEANHRVGAFATPNAKEQPIPRAPEFINFQDNSGLEALAIDNDGALYTIPERTGRFDRPFPVYRFKDGKWSLPYAIPRAGSYLVVGADFGPDDLLYVLERDFSGVGFYTRVRRVDLEAFTSETILETGLGVHGNMEGISVWENPAGETIMTLIADDNYRRILSNEIAEYRIDG